MPIRITREADLTTDTLLSALDEIRSQARDYTATDQWTAKAVGNLPKGTRAIVARDSDRAVALLLITCGFLEPWGAPTDLLGGNPLLPRNADAAHLHAILLSEATSWAVQENLTGVEVLLPMGEANMIADESMDAFHRGLGFDPFYYTMVHTLDRWPGCATQHEPEFVPAAGLSREELYANYAACVAGGEIERIARQSSSEREEYFDSLTDDTLGHPGSVALLQDDRLTGFALVAPMSDTAAHLAWIGITPTKRGRGFGRCLLTHVMETCKAHQVERMSLYTDTSVGAQTLYGKLGFVRAGTLTYRWRRPTA